MKYLNTDRLLSLFRKTGRQTSLVIPCAAEDAPFIKLLLVSVNYQTSLPREVIISLSSTQQVEAEAWRKDWRRILHSSIELKVLDSSDALFAGINRQRGAEVATGRIVSFFDADDIQSRTRIQKIESAFNNPEIMVVYHRFLRPGQLSYPRPVADEFLYKHATSMYHRGWVSVRKAVVKEVAWDSSPRAQDFTYLIALLEKYEKCCIALIPEFHGCFVEYDFRQATQDTEDRFRNITESFKLLNNEMNIKTSSNPSKCSLILNLDELPSGKNYERFIFCLIDRHGQEIYREDILDKAVLNKSRKSVIIKTIHMTGLDPYSYFLLPRLEDHSFLRRYHYELPNKFITRYNKLFSWKVTADKPK